MHKVLIIEDEASLASALGVLMKRLGTEPVLCSSAAQGLQKLSHIRPSLVILDIGLPDRSGLDVLESIRDQQADLPVLIITAHGNLQNAVEAKKRGASAYLVKPLDLPELQRTVKELLHTPTYPLQAQDVPTPEQPPEDAALLIGSAPAMQPAFAAIAHATATNAPVIITGPTGIGKSLAGRIIHLHSQRRSGPFVTLSCASLPETLLESELFGHEKGAFTGAVQAKQGHIERADGGTLFLDEVAEISPAVQVKLLRLVEEKTFNRVGGREDIRVDLRIIAATHQNLTQAVAEKRFREDLYYRLRVLEVKLPPLHDRMSDLPALSAYLLAAICGPRSISLSEAAISILRQHTWPGNVRELRNVLEYAVATCTGNVIQPYHLPKEVLQGTSETPGESSSSLDAAIHEWLDVKLKGPVEYDTLHDIIEGRLLAALLPRYENKPTVLARELQMNRATLRKKLYQSGAKFLDEPTSTLSE